MRNGDPSELEAAAVRDELDALKTELCALRAERDALRSCLEHVMSIYGEDWTYNTRDHVCAVLAKGKP